VTEDRIFVMTGEHLADATAAALPGVPRDRILCEPTPRNTAPCMAWASAVIERLDPDALVFATSNGTPLTYARVSIMLGKARAVIGRNEVTWHDLRHTGATLAYAAGASQPDVQARLGHTTARAAAIYAHTTHDRDQLIAQRLNDLHAPAADTPRLVAV
jgi:integrase